MNGYSIYFDEKDFRELLEYSQWKYKQNGASEFDLREASALIKRAQQEKQNIRQIEAERGSQRALEEQREDVSLLPDREAERIQSEWREQAKQQATSYSDARNRNAQPRSTVGTDPSTTEGVLSWIKRTKLRGGLGGRKTLDKN